MNKCNSCGLDKATNNRYSAYCDCALRQSNVLGMTEFCCLRFGIAVIVKPVLE